MQVLVLPEAWIANTLQVPLWLMGTLGAPEVVSAAFELAIVALQMGLSWILANVFGYGDWLVLFRASCASGMVRLWRKSGLRLGFVVIGQTIVVALVLAAWYAPDVDDAV